MLRRSTIFFITLLCFLPACSSKKEVAPRALVEVGSTPEFQLLAQAKQSYDRGLYDLSLRAWTELRDSHPGSYFSELAELKIADCNFLSKRYPEASTAYAQFTELFRGSDAVDYAKFQIAESHLAQYRGPLRDQSPLKSAIESYTRLISEDPKSEYALLARKRLDKTREHLASHVASIAEFYLKTGKVDSSLGRLSQLANEYGDTQTASKKGMQLLEAYRSSGEVSAERLSEVETLVTSLHSKNPETIETINFASLRPSPGSVQNNSINNIDNGRAALIPRVIKSLDCREQEQALVFTLYSSRELEAPAVQSREPSFVSFSSFGGPEVETEEHQSCELSDHNISFNVVGRRITASMESESRASVFALDRPNRLVVVVKR